MAVVEVAKEKEYLLLLRMVVVAAVMYATVSEVAVEEPMVSRLESRIVLPTTENANPGGGSDTDEATVGDDEVGGGRSQPRIAGHRR